jgi:hypothetical protein
LGRERIENGSLFVISPNFTIPSKSAARILLEAKGYGATGSTMTDILGDIRTIVAAKRPDTALLFFTDGLT